MKLRQDVLNDIATRFIEAGVTERHETQSRALYTNVYGVDEANPDLQLLFDVAIQNRARSLSPSDYRSLSNKFDPEQVFDCSTHSEAFEQLLDIDDIGPKIVDEFLRKVVHVFGVKDEWESELKVPLDTHVVKALVKTGAVDLEGKDWEDDLNSNYQRIVNIRPCRDVSPRTRIGYYEFQDGFADAASQHDLPRIVFDELWLEHSRFISNPLLQSESSLSDLILPEFEL